MDPTLSCGLLYLSFELLINWHRWACKLSSTQKKKKKKAMKDAELVALAKAQWMKSCVWLLMGSEMILGAPPP